MNRISFPDKIPVFGVFASGKGFYLPESTGIDPDNRSRRISVCAKFQNLRRNSRQRKSKMSYRISAGDRTVLIFSVRLTVNLIPAILKSGKRNLKNFRKPNLQKNESAV